MNCICIEKDIESTINGLDNIDYKRHKNNLEFKLNDIVADKFGTSIQIRAGDFDANMHNISIIKRVNINKNLYLLPHFICNPIIKIIISFSKPILQITFLGDSNGLEL
jgi:hypothetical protein